MAAVSHDIGRPEESSVHNSETIVAPSEVRTLRTVIQPWEIEAAHAATGLSYDSLARNLPGARNLQLPSSAPPPPEEPVPTCPHCFRPPTLEFLQWAQSATVTTCPLCDQVVRPGNPQEDPNWLGHHPSVEVLRDYCHCRCICAETGFFTQEHEQYEDSDGEVDDMQVMMFQARIRRENQLPDLRLSGGNRLRLNDAAMAVNDAEDQAQSGSHETALRLLLFAYRAAQHATGTTDRNNAVLNHIEQIAVRLTALMQIQESRNDGNDGNDNVTVWNDDGEGDPAYNYDSDGNSDGIVDIDDIISPDEHSDAE